MGGRIRSFCARRAPITAIAALALGGAAVGLAGCGSDEAEDPPDGLSADAVLTALVSWTVQSEAPPTTDAAEPPVVYIAPASGETIGAGVQAAVVAATDGEATVRFADDKSEAFDDTSDDQAVHDDGVLLVVGALPSDESTTTSATAEVQVEWYRSPDDTGLYVVEFATTADGATVTGVTAG